MLKSQLKDMACRTLLLKLERMNEICLPARQRPSPNANRNRQIKEIPHDVTPIESSLKELRPLQIMTVETKDKDAPLLNIYYTAIIILVIVIALGKTLNI